MKSSQHYPTLLKIPKKSDNFPNRLFRVAIIEDDVAFGDTVLACLKLDLSFKGTLFLSAEEALEKFAFDQPDIVLVDIRLPRMSGVECVKLIRQTYPNVLSIVVSSVGDEQTIIEALVAGAQGYINKLNCNDELFPALYSVAEGKGYMSPDITRKVISQIQSSFDIRLTSEAEKLSPRELLVLKSLYHGYTYEQTAERLLISFQTVRTHARNAYEKLGVSSRKEAIAKIFAQR